MFKSLNKIIYNLQKNVINCIKKSVICMNGILIKLDIYDNGYTTFVYSLEFTFEM